MNQSFVIFLLLLLSGMDLHAMKSDWLTHLSTSDRFTIKAMTIDLDGNHYAAGEFYDTLYINSTNGKDTLIDKSFGETFIVKIDSCGALLWAKQFFGTSNTDPASMALNSKGELIIVGTFSASTDFDPSSTTFSVSTQGGNAIYIVKLNANGELLDVGRLGGSPGMYSPRVTVDSEDNIYTAFVFSGGFSNNPVDLNPSLTESLFFTPTGIDGGIIKMFPNGDLDWVYQIRGPGFQIFAADIVTNNDQVTAAFHFFGGINFDVNGGVQNLQSRNFRYDGLTISLDSSRNFIGYTHYVGSQNALSRNVKNAPNNQLYLSGRYNDSLSVLKNNQSHVIRSLGEYDAYLSRVNKNGDLIWMRTLSSSSNVRSLSMNVGTNGNIYISGVFKDSLRIESTVGEQYLVSPQKNSQFLAIYRPDGELISVDQIEIETSLQSRTVLDQNNLLYLVSNYSNYSLKTYDGDSSYTVNGNEEALITKFSDEPNRITLGEDTSLCSGDSLLLAPNLKANDDVSWSNGAESNQLWIKNAGTYSVRVTNCGRVFRDTIEIKEVQKPTVFLGMDTTVCEKDTVTISPQLNNVTKYSWNTADTSIDIKTNEDGMFILKVFNGPFCNASDTLNIVHVEKPFIFDEKSKTVCGKDSITLDAGNPSSTYVWSTGEISREIQVSEDGFYKVIVDNGFCTETDSIFLTFVEANECIPQISIPNVFTPNQDGINDCLRIKHQHIEKISLSIFDRWGKKVFHTNNKDFVWDGRIADKQLPAGMYYVIANYSYFTLEEMRLEKKQYKGTIYIIR